MTGNFTAVQTGSQTFSLVGNVSMTIFLQRPFPGPHLKFNQNYYDYQCKSNCVKLVSTRGDMYLIQSPEMSAAYSLCKTGYDLSIDDGYYKYECPAAIQRNKSIPTCQDLSMGETRPWDIYTDAVDACLMDGVVYTAPGVMANASSKTLRLDAECKRGFKTYIRAYGSPASSSPDTSSESPVWHLDIVQGAQSPLCVPREKEDVWTVVGVTSAKILCTYAFVAVIFYFVQAESPWAKLLTAGMYDAHGPEGGGVPDAADPTETAVESAVMVADVLAEIADKA